VGSLTEEPYTLKDALPCAAGPGSPSTVVLPRVAESRLVLPARPGSERLGRVDQSGDLGTKVLTRPES
jgi:hypothetical protein